MSRAEQIYNASIIPIGGCEDAAKNRVMQLFKKVVKLSYHHFSDDDILTHDKKYVNDLIEYSILSNKEALYLFNDGSELTHEENITLSSYAAQYGEIDFSYYLSLYIPKLIKLSNITYEILHITPIKSIKNIKAIHFIDTYFKAVFSSIASVYNGIINHVIYTKINIFYNIFYNIFIFLSDIFIHKKGSKSIVAPNTKILKDKYG